MVYLGLLAEYQGISHLLRAIQVLSERDVKAHFLIMGFPGEARYRILAEQLIARNGLLFRLLFWWMARASNSLPVPVSPPINTVESLCAAREAMSSTDKSASDLPMMLLNPY